MHPLCSWCSLLLGNLHMCHVLFSAYLLYHICLSPSFRMRALALFLKCKLKRARSKPQWVCCRDERLRSHQWKKRESLASGITAMSHFVMQHAGNILCTEMWLYGPMCLFRNEISQSEKACTVQYFWSILMVLVLSSHYRYILWSVLICVYDLLWIIFFLTWLEHTNSVITAVKIQFLKSGPLCSLIKPRTAHFDRKDSLTCKPNEFVFLFFFLFTLHL